MAEFKDRLRELRKEKGWPQHKLAGKVNYTTSMISSFERGLRPPTLPAMLRLAELFNVSLDYLAGLTDIKNPPADGNQTKGKM